MTTTLVPRATWTGRLALWVGRTFRLVNVIEEPEEHVAGGDYATGLPTSPRYDPRRAMSALPANAWLAAGVNARASDLASLPLRATLDGEQVEAPEVLGLFSRALRMQILADLDLAGNAFLLTLSGVTGPLKVLRLHPARVEIVPNDDGSVRAFEYKGDGDRVVTYLPGDVQHIRGVSWEDGPEGLWGQGAIQSLDADIVADRNLANASARAAAKGRPDAIATPSNKDVTLNPRQVAEAKNNLDRVFQSNEGGVAVLSGHLKLDVLGWSPREMEGVAQREWTRQTILARLGVPGTRVGLPDANYATAEAQLGIYWTNLRSAAALVDEALSRIAQMHTEGLEVYHDFSQVPALQVMQTAALGRVEKHIRNGMPAPLAYRYEGFDDVADDWFVLPEGEAPAPAPAPAEDATPPAPAPLRLVSAAPWQEVTEELAAALAILTDDEADAEDYADALASIQQALDAARQAQSEAA